MSNLKNKQLTFPLSGSFIGSLFGTASWAQNALTASSADDFLVRGTLTAQTIVAQTITSSTDFVTGSTRFGSLLSNTHQFTGSVSITGSLNVVGAGITGSLFGTSSWAENVSTSSLTGSFFAQGGNSFGTTAMLGTNDSQSLAIKTSGSIRMLISGSGNVGIGTTIPQRTLHVDASGTANTDSPLLLTSVDTNNRVGITFASSSIPSGRTHRLIHRVNSSLAEWLLGTTAGQSAQWTLLPKDDTNFGISLLAPFNGGNAYLFTGISQSLFSIGVGGSNQHLNINSSGSIGIGSTSLTGYNLRVSKNITGATTSYGISSEGTIQSDVTVTAAYYRAIISQAAGFTTSVGIGYWATQGTISGTMTSQIGFYADNMTSGSLNVGFYGNIASGSGRWNLYMNGTADNYLAGSLIIGGGTVSGYTLRLTKAVTGATTYVVASSSGQIQPDVTTTATYFSSAASQAAGGSLSFLNHYEANQGTLSGTVTTQYGFIANSSLIGATNNYGFLGSIPSGSGRWNLFMNGTADNYMAGALGIGTTSLTGYTLRLAKTITGAASSVALYQTGIVQSDVVNGYGFLNNLNTAASAFTLSNYFHFQAGQSTIGSGSSITTQVGFRVDSSLISASFNYGFRGLIPSGSNRWNLYMDGTADNYLAGALGIGTTSMAMKFNVNDSSQTYVAQFRGSNSSYIVSGDTSLAGESGINFRNSTGQGFLAVSGAVLGFSATSGANTISLSTGGSEGIRLTSNRNTILQNGGTFVDGGQRLQVSGSSRFVGDMIVTGSLTVTNGITGSLFGTASWSTNTTSASYALIATSASYASASTSASFATTAVSASFATNAANAFIQNGNSFGATATLGTNDNNTLQLETNNRARVQILGDGNIIVPITSSMRPFMDGMYINVHPEGDNPAIIPYLGNDIAYNTLRGGTFTGTPGSGSTVVTTAATAEAMFDGAPSYAFFNTPQLSGSYTASITFPQSYFYGNVIGFSFGAAYWRAQNFTVELLVTGSYYLLDSVTNWQYSSYNKYWQGGADALQGMRITFSNFIDPNGFRIADIFLLNFNSQYGKAIYVGRDGGQIYKSIAVTGSVTATTGLTGSLFGTSSWAQNAISSSFVSTASSADNFLVRGTLTAQTIVAQTITSSTNFITGSTRFGSLISNTHQFTGSVSITGSLTVTGSINGSFTGSLLGTSSWATNSLTASYANSVFDVGIAEFNSTSSTTTAGTTVVSSINTGSFTSAFYNYTIASGSNARAGQVMSVWSGSTVRYTEVTTTDIGNTATASFAVAISGPTVRLNFTAPGVWTVKSIANLL